MQKIDLGYSQYVHQRDSATHGQCCSNNPPSRNKQEIEHDSGQKENHRINESQPGIASHVNHHAANTGTCTHQVANSQNRDRSCANHVFFPKDRKQRLREEDDDEKDGQIEHERPLGDCLIEAFQLIIFVLVIQIGDNWSRRSAQRREEKIESNELIELMIEHNISVTLSAKYEIKKIDSDYFIEDLI